MSNINFIKRERESERGWKKTVVHCNFQIYIYNFFVVVYRELLYPLHREQN